MMVTTWPFYGIITTLVFAQLVNAIEFSQQEIFIKILIFYTIFIVFYQIWNYFWSFYGQRFFWSLYQIIDLQYFKKFVTIDNNKAEIIGTGKMLSIIDKGVDQWVQLLSNTTRMGIAMVVNVVFAVYLATVIEWKW